MIVLLLSTLFSAAFGLVVRYAQRRNGNLLAVGALNYLTAALFHVALRASEGIVPPSPPTWRIGILAGIAYVTAYFFLVPFMKLRGVSIATAVVRLSVLIPVVFSVALWGERPNGMQTSGAILALMSLPLLGFHPSVGREGLRAKETLLLVALFLGNGLCLLSVRGYHQTGIQGEESLFLGILFSTAAVISNAVWLFRRAGFSRRDILPGVMLGLCNALGNLSLVAALQQLPGVFVFPFYSSIGLVFAAAFAGVVWRERISRIEAAGMTIAVGAVVLIHMG